MRKDSVRENGTSIADEVMPGLSRYRDVRGGRDFVRVGAGAYYVTTDEAEVLSAVLGSCISVCVRDPRTGVGGMNHFMLPSSNVQSSSPASPDLRLGVHSIEVLLNAVLGKNCKRSDLECKVFGGADLFGYKKPVGSLNGDFALSYLAREGVDVLASDIGGQFPRRVEYMPFSGVARVKLIEDKAATEIRKAEETYKRQLRKFSSRGPDFF